MKRVFSITMIWIMLFSCSPEDHINPEETDNGSKPGLNISAETVNVSSYQIIKLISTEGIFFNDSYITKLGDNEVMLIKETKETLKFIVPDLPPGDYDLKLEIDGKESKLNFKVSNPDINNLEETLRYQLEVPLIVMTETLKEIKAVKGSSAEVEDLMNSALLLSSNFNQKYSELSKDEKLKIAKFLKVNAIFSENFAGSGNKQSASTTEANCYTRNTENLFQSSQIISDWLEISDVILSSKSKGLEAAGVSTTVGAYIATTIFLASRDILVNHCTRPVSAHLKEENGEIESLKALNNSFKTWDLIFKERGLIANDINSEINIISATVREINSISSSWNKNIKMNESISLSSSWLNTWLKSDTGYRELQTSIPALPASVEEKLVPGDPGYVNIANLPSDVSVEILKEEAGKIKLKFSAPPSSLPRIISGKLNNSKPGFQFESPFQIKLSVAQSYTIQFGDYENVYSEIKPYMEISEGDAITLGNGMMHMIRFMINGEPLIHPAYPEKQGWGQWDFGSVPFTAADVLVEDYKVVFSGPNGENVEFKIDLTYSNMAYRTIVGSRVTVERISSGIKWGIYHVIFHENNRYTVTDVNLKYAGEGAYVFFPGLEVLENCPTYQGNRRQNGIIRLEGTPMTGAYPQVPPYIGIYPDNSLRYGCIDDPANQWKVLLNIN